MKRTITILALLFALISTSNLFAQVEKQDVVYLKDGDIVRGKLMEQSSEYIIFEVDNIKQKIDNDEIVKIVEGETFNPPYQHITNMSDNSKDDYMYGISYRNAGIATFYSFVMPGGGQFYNNQSIKGIRFMLWSGASSALMTYGLSMISRSDISFNFNSQNERISNTKDMAEIAIIIGSVSFLTSWIWSMVDADKSAKEINKKYLGNKTYLSLNPDYRLININNQTQQTMGLNMSLNF